MHHAFNPMGGRSRWSELETSLVYTVRPYLKFKHVFKGGGRKKKRKTGRDIGVMTA